MIFAHLVSWASGRLRWSWSRLEKQLSSCTASPQSSALPSRARCRPYTEKQKVGVNNTASATVYDSKWSAWIISSDCEWWYCSPLEIRLWWAHLKICILQLHCGTSFRSSSCTPLVPGCEVSEIKACSLHCIELSNWAFWCCMSYCQSLQSFPFLRGVDFMCEQGDSYLRTAGWSTATTLSSLLTRLADHLTMYTHTYPSSSLLIWSQKPMMYSQSSCLFVGWVALSDEGTNTTYVFGMDHVLHHIFRPYHMALRVLWPT